jgi:protein SCO1/2
LAVALSLASAVVLAGCAGSSDAAVRSPSSASASGWRGDRLASPVVLSARDRTVPFDSSEGGTTTLGRLQHGRLMLLYFGYTNCPDVCPTTMADLGQALRQLPVQVRSHTQVVFVTSDPARDTPAVLKAWLANFYSGLLHPFIGLSADIARVDAVAKSVGVPLSPPVKHSDGSITVQHGAQTMAFIDGKTTLLWLAGTSPADYAHDITRLAGRLDAA